MLIIYLNPFLKIDMTLAIFNNILGGTLCLFIGASMFITFEILQLVLFTSTKMDYPEQIQNVKLIRNIYFWIMTLHYDWVVMIVVLFNDVYFFRAELSFFGSRSFYRKPTCVKMAP